jgi:tRNA 2-thiouridine synthesizing protein A
MARTLDVRGLRCPLPLIHTRALLGDLVAGETLEVLATDPEAPIDLGALATDEGLELTVEHSGGEWRMTLRRPYAGSGSVSKG